MNKSNEDSNPQNPTKTSDLPTSQEKQQKGAESSRQDLQFRPVFQVSDNSTKSPHWEIHLGDPETEMNTHVLIWH